MEVEPYLLLQRYRRDRRRLLEFVISASGGSFDFSVVDLDTVSVDYVLECVQSDKVFDPLEAMKRYYEEWDYPIMLNLSSENSFFLLSKPELSGSPPRRAAPQIGGALTSDHSIHLGQREIKKSGIETISTDFAATFASNQLLKDANMLTLGLPVLSRGLFKDYLMMICEKQRMRCFLVQ